MLTAVAFGSPTERWCALQDSHSLTPNAVRRRVTDVVQGVTNQPKVGWRALQDSNLRPPGS
jgi:hypothetical protein